jgi:hypothetical protein
VPAYISIAIVVAYFMVKYHYKKTYIALMSLSILLLCLLRFPFLFPLPGNAVMISKFLGYSELFSQVAPLEKAGEPIIANSIQVASEAAFYLPGRPETYILDDWREYQFWSADLEQAILSGKIKSGLFVVDPADDQDVSKYFKNKILLKTVTYQGRWDTKTLDIYRVWNQ